MDFNQYDYTNDEHELQSCKHDKLFEINAFSGYNAVVIYPKGGMLMLLFRKNLFDAELAEIEETLRTLTDEELALFVLYLTELKRQRQQEKDGTITVYKGSIIGTLSVQ